MIADVIQSLPTKGNGSRIVELGKIKIGGLGKPQNKQGGGTYRMPRKDDHFTITTLHRKDGQRDGDLMPDAKLMEQLTKEYGDSDGRLRQIPIRVLSDDVEDILQTAFVWYAGKTAGARSDGKSVTWYRDPTHGPTFGKAYAEPIEDTWSPEMLNYTDARGVKLFKTHTVFNCVIAANDARWGGVYKFRTTSIVTLQQLYGTLLQVSQLTGGILMGMPLRLVVRPIQVSPEGKAATVYVVHCELRGPDLKQIQDQALAQARFKLEFKDELERTKRQYRKLLTAPGAEPEEEASAIVEEFAPEATDVAPAPERYGVLDDEPAPIDDGVAAMQAATMTTADVVDSRVTDPEIADLPSDNQSHEQGDEGETASTTDVVEVASAARVAQAAPVDVHDLARLKEVCGEAVMDSVPLTVFEEGWRKIGLNVKDFLDARKSRHERPRREVLAAAKAGRVDWANGKIVS